MKKVVDFLNENRYGRDVQYMRIVESMYLYRIKVRPFNERRTCYDSRLENAL